MCYFNAKMIKYFHFIFFVLLFLLKPLLTLGQIETIPGLILWVRSDSAVLISGNKVQQWSDISGNNRHLIQNNPIYQPLFIPSVDSLNYKPALYFNNSFLVNNDSIKIGTLFILANAQPPVFNDYQGLFTQSELTNGATDYLLVSTVGTTNFYPSPLGSNLFINNQQTYNFHPLEKPKIIKGILNSPITWNSLMIGYDRSIGSRFWKGNIFEIIVFNRPLSLPEQQQVEMYLMNKYAPPVNLGPDTIELQIFCPYQLNVSNSYQSVLWSTGQSSHSIQITSSGIYWVQVIDIFNRITIDSIVIKYPEINIPDTIICLGDSIQVYSPLNSPYYTYLWSTSETSTSIYLSEEGQYWLRVTDSLLCSRTDTFNIYVDNFSIYASLGPDVSVCRNAPLTLLNGANEAISYLWSTGDTTAYILIDTAGVYSVTVTNARGCLAVDSITIQIKGQQPIVGFYSTTSCYKQPTLLIDTSWAIPPDVINARYWIIGNDTFFTPTVQLTFPSPGNHLITLIITTDSGCVASTTKDVFVIPNPVASFMPLQGCSNKPIQMNNQTIIPYGSIHSWQWWALDTSNQQIFSSTETHPIVTFAEPGIYELYLVATTSDNCRDTALQTIEIRRTPPVDFEWEQVCFGLPTIFHETTQVPPYEMIIHRQWHFGANNFAYTPTTTFQFTQPNTYSVSLYNKSINGCENTITKDVVIYPLPVAQFDVSTTCINLPVQFINTSFAPQSTISSVLWHLPWGDTTSIFSPIVLFPDTGKYPVSLTVFTAQECSKTYTDTIIIHPTPLAQFEMSEYYGLPPLAVQFFNQSIGASSWLWNFGDGYTSNQENPTHIFEQENIYTIELIALNQWGCSDTTYQVLYVIPTILDLGITKVSLIDTLSFYRINIELANFGTRIINQCQIWLKVDNTLPIIELVDALLHPGDKMSYFLTSLLNPESLKNHQVLCIVAKTVGNHDSESNLANNFYCISLNNQLQLLPIIFHPYQNLIFVSILSTQFQEANITIINTFGQEVFNSFNIQLLDGYNTFNIDATTLSSGIYHIIVETQQHILTRSFSIIR